MGQENLKKFDRYYLLDCIAQGGMAEIFRARPAYRDSAGRLVVIKRILPAYGKNPDFVNMFKSETQVMMRFNHPHLTSLFECGDYDGQPYIAMEYVEGKNLRQILQRSAERKTPFPVEAAVQIIEDAAAGLHYAHSLRDRINNQPLSIIHRDISPQNLLVSYEGVVKVIDFGIAKASTNGEKTEVGIIKGKPSYLSPEQVALLNLDGRSDVFSLGAVLWEILAGRKLFAAQSGENELAVLRLIQSSDSHVKPPSTVNPKVPGELDEIVLKALTQDRDRRFQSAEEFQDALRRFRLSHYLDFSEKDVAKFVKSLFGQDLVDDQKLLRSLNAKVETLLSESTDSSSSGSEPTDQVRKVEVPEAFKAPAPGTVRPDPLQVSRPAIAVFRPNAGARPRPGTKPVPMVERSRPSMKREEIGSGGSGFTSLIVAAGLAAVVYFYGLPEYEKYREQRNRTTPQTEVKAEPKPTKPLAVNDRMISLKLVPNFPVKGGTASINGQAVSTDQFTLDVPLDTPLRVVAEIPGFKPYEREMVLPSDQLNGLKETQQTLELDPVSFGYLNISSTPTSEIRVRPIDARVIASESRPWILRTPIENEKLPSGRYQLTFENRALGMSKSMMIEVREGRTDRISVQLEVMR